MTAQPGEDAAALAKRMSGIDNSDDAFLILNGLERTSATPAGERYKVVAP